jgi:energy-converting hydrogenase B subunit D
VTTFWVLDYLLLALVLAAALLVAGLRNLNGATMSLSAVGTLLAVLFIVLGAPDVAHAEVAVGAIALPVLFLVAIGKSRTVTSDPGTGETGGIPDGDPGPGSSAAGNSSAARNSSGAAGHAGQ